MQLKQTSSFRIFYQNVNGIYKGNSWTDWKAMANQAQLRQIDVIGFTETNIKWNPKIQQAASSLAQRYTKNCQMATSTHNGLSFGNYQPGGTSTSICGNAIGHIVTKINDTSSMGRWSGFKLHTNNGTHINILTVYQSTKSNGIYTNYIHQVEYLKNNDSKCKDLRKQLLLDLQSVVNTYNRQNELTIILMDANESLYKEQSLLPTFLHSTNLCPLKPQT
jgi:hypothetical protein